MHVVDAKFPFSMSSHNPLLAREPERAHTQVK